MAPGHGSAGVQAFFQLESGKVVTLVLDVDAERAASWIQPGVSHSSESRMQVRPTDRFITQTFRTALMGQMPSGFESVRAPTLGSHGPVAARAKAAYRSPEYLLIQLALRGSADGLPIAPQDLAGEHVVAVLIDGDHVNRATDTMAVILVTNRHPLARL